MKNVACAYRLGLPLVLCSTLGIVGRRTFVVCRQNNRSIFVCTRRWQAIDSEQNKNVVGALSVFYAFPVLYSSSFFYGVFRIIFCGVFRDDFAAFSPGRERVLDFACAHSWGTLLFGFKYAVRRGLRVWFLRFGIVLGWVWLVFVGALWCLGFLLLLFFSFFCLFKLDFFDLLWR